jgi:hypothetical protein
VDNHLSQTNIHKQNTVKSTGVKAVEIETCEDVYNMEVADNHNFAINDGLIVHNCMDSTRYFVKTMKLMKPQTKYKPIWN